MLFTDKTMIILQNMELLKQLFPCDRRRSPWLQSADVGGVKRVEARPLFA